MIEHTYNKCKEDLVYFDSKGILHFPEGYLYCNHCDGFTEHTKGRWGDPVCTLCEVNTGPYLCEHCNYEYDEEVLSSGRTSEVIIVHNPGCHCGDFGRFDENDEWEEAEKCSGNVDEDMFYTGSYHSKVTSYAHAIKKDFLYKKQRKNDQDHIFQSFDVNPCEYDSAECGCPRKSMISPSMVVSYAERSVYSLDCMNAIEWDFELRCPICGTISFFNDGNC